MGCWSSQVECPWNRAEGRSGAAERARAAAAPSAPPEPSAPTLNIVVAARALAPAVTAPALAVALRLLQTAQDFSRSQAHWRQRPRVRGTSRSSAPLRAPHR